MIDPVMTLHELGEALRANGIPCSEPKLRDMILAEKFPFAYGTGGPEKATLLIFRAAFYNWLDGMLGTPSVRI